MSRTPKTNAPTYRYRVSGGPAVTLEPPTAGTEVSGTCQKCRRTLYLKVAPELASSFQGCDRVNCPECYPQSGTHWYFKE